MLFLIVIISILLFLVAPPVGVGFFIVGAILNAFGKGRRELKKIRKEIKKKG